MLDNDALTNLTPPRVPLTDPRTGYISREWYLFFFSQFSRSKSLTSQSNANEAQIGSTTLTLEETQAQLAALAVEFEGATLGPLNTPQLPRLRYGSFYDTTTQVAAAPNTAYAMTFNSTDMSTGVYIGSPTSRIYVDTPNVYNIQFSAQLDKTSGGVGLWWAWLRKNGVDIPNSASQVRLQGNDAELVAAWNFLLRMNAGDYFELMWETDTVDIQITAFAASGAHPAIPSVILTVIDNISV